MWTLQNSFIFRKMIEIKIKTIGVKTHSETNEKNLKQKEISMTLYELEKIKLRLLKIKFKGDQMVSWGI